MERSEKCIRCKTGEQIRCTICDACLVRQFRSLSRWEQWCKADDGDVTKSLEYLHTVKYFGYGPLKGDE